MENIIKIPTAAQAREAVNEQANLECEKIWGDILHTVKNSIHSAIKDCKHRTYIYESSMRGVSFNAVYEKLKPMLTGMGYKVEKGKFSGIYISWEEGTSNESQ